MVIQSVELWYHFQCDYLTFRHKIILGWYVKIKHIKRIFFISVKFTFLYDFNVFFFHLQVSQCWYNFLWNNMKALKGVEDVIQGMQTVWTTNYDSWPPLLLCWDKYFLQTLLKFFKVFFFLWHKIETNGPDILKYPSW